MVVSSDYLFTVMENINSAVVHYYINYDFVLLVFIVIYLYSGMRTFVTRLCLPTCTRKTNKVLNLSS